MDTPEPRTFPALWRQFRWPDVGQYVEEQTTLRKAMTSYRLLLCFLGKHVWDGRTEADYPTPRCYHCGKFFNTQRRKREEQLGFHDVVYFTCHHREDWDDCPDCRH